MKNKKELNSYFISFALPHKNLGIVCTQAESPETALAKVSKAGMNPGGEAAIWHLPHEEAETLGYDRLISPEEMRQGKGYKSILEVSTKEKKNFMNGATVACQVCNETKKN